MAVDLTVPALGESITEAIVGKWHKKVGESVKEDEAVVVLETDKVTVDVPAPASGAISLISRKEGEKVKVGEVLGTIDAAGKSAAAPSATKTAATADTSSAPMPGAQDSRTAHLTPVARRVVEEQGIDPAKIKGSGPGGRIRKEDVLEYVDSRSTSATQPISRVEVSAAVTPQGPVQTKSPAPAPSAPRAKGEREERVTMTPLRKRVAERLLAAQSNAAILTTFNEADMSGVNKLRKQYADKFLEKHGVKLGFMSFFVRAAIEALKAFPQVNAEIDGDEVVFKHYYDIGVAVSGSRGLVVPVLRDADSLTMAEIEKRVAELGQKARTDKLTLADLSGGTFTISNGGIFGSMMSTPILNPPQVGILGMHNIVDRAVVRDGQIVIRPMMYLALSYDHRLIDGREAVSFLVRIKDCIETPERLLLEV
jgi:2-oxoglutarate dehydrogenase E2 component (dihydrolipoamide succinyltransferase)